MALFAELKPRHWLLFFLIVLMLIPGIRLSAHDPEIFKAAWNSGHFFWPLMIIPAFIGSLRTRILSLPRRLLLCAAVVMTLAVAIELAQLGLGRSATLDDILLTLYGVIAGSFVVLIVRAHNRVQQGLLVLALLGVLLTGLKPLLTETWIFVRSWQQFPLIDDFDDWTTLTRWRGSNLRLTDELLLDDEADYDIPAWADQKGWLQLPLKSSPQGKGWRNAIMLTMPADWSDYQTLTIRLHLSAPAQIGVRLDDLWYIREGGEAYINRMNKSYELPAGFHELVLPEQLWTQTPSRRKLDKTEIERFILYARAVSTEITVSVAEIYLR
ncbi:hypothetical protein [Allohahella marinimesophila]|uniref:hypothetical protein n=1 Tax=Allohahella marinimesophila TaxID=1054972 RepID=UPI0031D0437E